ncbi:hypothetical protein MYAER_3238 [Microcystis aeruginosa NIES-2549]|uniref:Uncharacterized protein n=2 Tax=Microcystis aeruginosa TaxID=1126 RepID=A0A0F6U6F5_MICAE|nr:hypothetical protein MYAER_3238 [Microcystis aeruginosa NIES-2549]AOC53990.1 hypothetical protein amyaer_3285 [Microcystis aeruginosa NIES-2481]
MDLLRLAIINKNLIYFLVFNSDVADKNIQIMTGVSQTLQSNPNGNNPEKLLVNNDNSTIFLDLYGQVVPEITKIEQFLELLIIPH